MRWPVYCDVMCNAWPWHSVVDWQDDVDRKEETLAIIADLLGFSWTGKPSTHSFYFDKKYIDIFDIYLYFATYV